MKGTLQERDLYVLPIQRDSTTMFQFNDDVLLLKLDRDRASTHGIRVIRTLDSLYDNGKGIFLTVFGKQVVTDATEGEVLVVKTFEMGLTSDRAFAWARFIAADPNTMPANARVAVLFDRRTGRIALARMYAGAVRTVHALVTI